METKNFVMFALNYPHDFISRVWSGHMVGHLESKFSQYYSDYGSWAVMVKFYAELSEDNRELLTRFINDVYYKHGS